jgi:hypothetical protein
VHCRPCAHRATGERKSRHHWHYRYRVIVGKAKPSPLSTRCHSNESSGPLSHVSTATASNRLAWKWRNENAQRHRQLLVTMANG